MRTVTIAIRHRALVALALVASLGAAGAQTPDPISRIREADLRADLFVLASDAMRGREAGTVDELNASTWLADRAREAGLQPAGDNGTYFQFFPLERLRVSASSPVALGGASLHMGRDAFTDAVMLATVDAPVVIVQPDALPATGLAGKAVVVRYTPPPGPLPMPSQSNPNAASGLRVWARAIARGAGPQNPAAVVVIVPEADQDQWDRTIYSFPRGTYGLDPDGTAPVRAAPRGVPLLYVRESALGGASASLAPDARLVAAIGTDSFQYPSVNVVAKVTGTDVALSSEYVLFSAHTDHDGVRYAVNGDDIWNGADDNASTAVALLAIGRAVSAAPLRRSALFVWHGAEERGLMGSRWYVKHPTVSLASIVACLNGDMIGRNDPATAGLLGALPPHRNSPDLVQAALDANGAITKFTVDSSWDDPKHPEGWYYRSDHLAYARAGVPALFFTTLLHSDYHTPADNPDRVDTAKLTKMAQWMYATGRTVGNADQRPAVDPAFKLERCRDSTGTYCGG